MQNSAMNSVNRRCASGHYVQTLQRRKPLHSPPIATKCSSAGKDFLRQQYVPRNSQTQALCGSPVQALLKAGLAPSQPLTPSQEALCKTVGGMGGRALVEFQQLEHHDGGLRVRHFGGYQRH